MTTALRRHLTPGNAVAVAAMIVALAGTGVAASNLANGSVTSAKLANNAVSTPKLANNAVTAAKLAQGSVKAAKLANGAVTLNKVAKESLDATRFKPGVLGGVSASKVTVVPGTPVSVPPGSTGTTATATCPAGQRAIAGGFNVGAFALADATGPTGDGTGWTVTAETGATPASISATVVCVAP